MIPTPAPSTGAGVLFCRGWICLTPLDYSRALVLRLRSPAESIADNGDMLGLSLGKADQGTVVYLAHDSEHQIIASSLASFLSEWAKCNYVGPEIWIIEEFLDSSSGNINGDRPSAERLRVSMKS